LLPVFWRKSKNVCPEARQGEQTSLSTTFRLHFTLDVDRLTEFYFHPTFLNKIETEKQLPDLTVYEYVMPPETISTEENAVAFYANMKWCDLKILLHFHCTREVGYNAYSHKFVKNHIVRQNYPNRPCRPIGL
jgi:hypothetical protein